MIPDQTRREAIDAAPEPAANDVARHTPGPWFVGETRYAGGYQLVHAADQCRGYICEVQAPIVGDTQFDLQTRQANAALVARAPEMAAQLAALQAECARLRLTWSEPDDGLIETMSDAFEKSIDSGLLPWSAFMEAFYAGARQALAAQPVEGEVANG